MHEKNLTEKYDIERKFHNEWAESIDLEDVFGDQTVFNIPDVQIDLAGKSAKEQSEILSQYFSNIGNTVIKDSIPWLEEFSLAGEEMIDTLKQLYSNLNYMFDVSKELDNLVSETKQQRSGIIKPTINIVK